MGLIRNRFVRNYIRAVPGAIRLAASSRWPIGLDVFKESWDVLIILDTCRIDALKSVKNEYHFLGDISGKTSIGGATPEWISNTFTTSRETDLEKTGFISASGWSKAVIEDKDRPESNLNCPWAPTNWSVASPSVFGLLDHSWMYINEQVPGNENVHPSPQKMTERAIHFSRTRDLDRIIVHYVQPHYPYVSQARAEGRDTLRQYEESPFEFLRSGGDRELVWEAYMSELRTALDSVQTLLENIDSSTVAITADHGEAFGEYWMHGHRSGSFHPKVRRVPWVLTTASDEETVNPDINTRRTRGDVVEQLKGLGYLD